VPNDIVATTQNKETISREQNNRRTTEPRIGGMWSKATRNEEKKEAPMSVKDPPTRNVRFIHMQISTPKSGNKTRAQKVKEALMIIFATSKYIKLHPKESGAGEIITNIDDLITTEEVTKQYFFDKKSGKKYIRGEGAVDYYITKVRLETNIGLSQMKWQTSTKFLEALKAQNIFLNEYQDGKTMTTGNVGWLVGMNPTSTSIAKATNDLNTVLTSIETTAILDVHTVSIRFPSKKKAFVTRAYKIMSNIQKLEDVRMIINDTLQGKKMGVGWEDVELVSFNSDKNTTAMMIERHNKTLHDTAVIAIKNIWSITEKETEISDDEIKQLGLDITSQGVKTIEEVWWHLANKYKHDIRGMVTRRGTLELLTTRKNLDETVGFARELIMNTIKVIGERRFASMTANHNPDVRKPTIQEAPMILEGLGRVKLDTSHFTEQEFKNFARKHGIPLNDNEDIAEVQVDTTRPPKAFYHKAGREPVEHDPRKMREGAISVWEKFADKQKRESRKITNETVGESNTMTSVRPPSPMQRETTKTHEDIVQKGKLLRLESSLKKLRDSQDELEKTTSNCQDQMVNMTKRTEDSIDRMSDMITKMGDSITVQNRQLEAQAKAQVKQAEDIQRIMSAIHAISNVVQATPPVTQESNSMQIDIPASNYNKRKQTSLGLTTPFTDNTYESIMTPPRKAMNQKEGVHGAEQQ
jgi:hypothetical protein